MPDAVSSIRSAVEQYYCCSGRDLNRDRLLHSRERNALLVETDELFLMARPVDLGGGYPLIAAPGRMFPLCECNAWFIHLMIGRLDALADLRNAILAYRKYAYLRGKREDFRLHWGLTGRLVGKINNKQQTESYGIF